MIDFELTDEQKWVVENVRKMAAKEFAPTIQEDDIKGHYAPDTFSKLAKMGVTGICFPEKYGGAGMDYISLGLACEELEYVDTSLRTILSVHVGLSGCGIYQWGTEEQKEKFLKPMAGGEKFGVFGLTEPDAGSDVAGMKSYARKDGNQYVLNGQKIWISGADYADLFLVFAYTNKEKKHEGISAFILERGMPGLSTFTLHNKVGIRAGNVGGIVMQDVKVPKENLVGEEGEGFKIAMSCLDNGRFTVAAGSTGLIRACLDASVKYAKERKTFGKPICDYQLVQEMLAKMGANYDAAKLLWLRAGWLKNKGMRNTRETSLAKWLGTVSAFEAANDAIEIHGAYGYSDEYPVGRFLRNAKGEVIYEGTIEVHKLIQAEYVLGYRKDKELRQRLPAYEPAQSPQKIAAP